MTTAAMTAPASLNPLLTGTLDTQKTGQTKATAKEFEAVFLSQMMSHMFEGMETDSMFGGGSGEDMFRSMLVQEYGAQMAKGNGIGMSDQIQKMMIRMQQQ